MVSDEESSTASIRTGDKRHDQKVVTLSGHPKDPVSLDGRLTKADRVRGVTRSLVVDALDTLHKMAKDCHKTPELLENYYQLYHCLDYLKRFCDGKV
jgi:hypothetical protein